MQQRQRKKNFGREDLAENYDFLVTREHPPPPKCQYFPLMELAGIFPAVERLSQSTGTYLRKINKTRMTELIPIPVTNNYSHLILCFKMHQEVYIIYVNTHAFKSKVIEVLTFK